MKLRSRLKRSVHNHPAYGLVRHLREAWKEMSDWRSKVVSLEAPGPALGNALVSYITEPFLRKAGENFSTAHQHDWESWDMAQALLEMGYNVDIIRWNNIHWLPTNRYDVFIDARVNMERLAPLLGPDCLKIMYVDTAHWLFNMTAQHQRLLDLQQRRGVTLPLEKAIAANWAIEHADCGIIQGNRFAADTYAYTKKPLYRIHTSVMATYPFPSDRDIQSSRRNFLWLGSSGLVHKGLDLVLEAFAGMPELRLIVCAPFTSAGDRPFEREYRKELYETPNIETVGWVDVSGPKLPKLAADCIGTVYVSASESGGGSVLQCMHAGLIPVVSYESSVDMEDFGFVLASNTVGEIRAAMRHVATLPEAEVRRRTRAAWEFARAHHTREQFAKEYRAALRQIFQERGRSFREVATETRPENEASRRQGALA